MFLFTYGLSLSVEFTAAINRVTRSYFSLLYTDQNDTKYAGIFLIGGLAYLKQHE